MEGWSSMDRRRSHNHASGGKSNFSRSGAAAGYYSFGAQAAKVEEKKDEVSLKYYGKMKRIERRSAVRGSIPKIICAFIICTCSIAIVFARSKVYNFQLENEALSAELEAKREKTVSIIAQSTEKIDLAYVEETAKTRLNMAKPQSWQIVYIEVPKTDYTVMHEASTVVEKEKTAVASYKNFISGLKETSGFLIGDKTERKTD